MRGMGVKGEKGSGEIWRMRRGLSNPEQQSTDGVGRNPISSATKTYSYGVIGGDEAGMQGTDWLAGGSAFFFFGAASSSLLWLSAISSS
jgi:hypothetical protein